MKIVIDVPSVGEDDTAGAAVEFGPVLPGHRTVAFDFAIGQPVWIIGPERGVGTVIGLKVDGAGTRWYLVDRWVARDHPREYFRARDLRPVDKAG